MASERRATGWEYSCLGPADSFQGLVCELKAKTKQGWELAGIMNESCKVYATVKRRVHAAAVRGRRAA